MGQLPVIGCTVTCPSSLRPEVGTSLGAELNKDLLAGQRPSTPLPLQMQRAEASGDGKATIQVGSMVHAPEGDTLDKSVEHAMRLGEAANGGAVAAKIHTAPLAVEQEDVAAGTAKVQGPSQQDALHKLKSQTTLQDAAITLPGVKHHSYDPLGQPSPPAEAGRPPGCERANGIASTPGPYNNRAPLWHPESQQISAPQQQQKRPTPAAPRGNTTAQPGSRLPAVSTALKRPASDGVQKKKNKRQRIDMLPGEQKAAARAEQHYRSRLDAAAGTATQGRDKSGSGPADPCINVEGRQSQGSQKVHQLVGMKRSRDAISGANIASKRAAAAAPSAAANSPGRKTGAAAGTGKGNRLRARTTAAGAGRANVKSAVAANYLDRKAQLRSNKDYKNFHELEEGELVADYDDPDGRERLLPNPVPQGLAKPAEARKQKQQGKQQGKLQSKETHKAPRATLAGKAAQAAAKKPQPEQPHSARGMQRQPTAAAGSGKYTLQPRHLKKLAKLCKPAESAHSGVSGAKRTKVGPAEQPNQQQAGPGVELSVTSSKAASPNTSQQPTAEEQHLTPTHSNVQSHVSSGLVVQQPGSTNSSQRLSRDTSVSPDSTPTSSFNSRTGYLGPPGDPTAPVGSPGYKEYYSPTAPLCSPGYREFYSPTAPLGSPGYQEDCSPTAPLGSPGYQEDYAPTAYLGSPGYQEDYSPTAPLRSPGYQEDYSPTAPLRSPGYQEFYSPTAPLRSPGYQEDYYPTAPLRSPGYQEFYSPTAPLRSPGYQESYDPTAPLRSPGYQERYSPTAPLRSPGYQECYSPTAPRRSPACQECYSPTAPLRSPGCQECYSPTAPLRSPAYQECYSPTAPLRSPGCQELWDTVTPWL